jgi:hypothetical protein
MAKVKKKSPAPIRKTPKSHPKSGMITWIIIIALLLGIVGGYLFAKMKYTHYIGEISVMFNQKDSQLNEMKAKMNEMNGVMKVGGKMMVVKDGKVSMMTEQETLGDGTVVQPNGQYQKPNDEMMMMQNGEAFDMKGNMISDNENKVEF